MNDTEKQLLIENNKRVKKQWDLPKILKHYETTDFATRQKVRFVYFLCFFVIASMFFIILSSSFLQLTNPINNRLNIFIILLEIILLMLFLLYLVLLIKGYYHAASHLIVISALTCVWLILWIDNGDTLTRLDSIVFILGILAMSPLLVSKNKFLILFYTFFNVVMLFIFSRIVGKQLNISANSLNDYTIDVSITILFIGLVGYSIFNINKRSLDQAMMDIKERRQAEEELKQSRDQFQSLVSNIPGITYRCLNDNDWTMLYMSSEIEQFSGYPSSDFINNKVRSYESIIKNDDNLNNILLVQEAIQLGNPWEMEYRIHHKDGTIRWVYEKGRGVIGFDGKVDFLDGFILDITERKEMETLLRKSEEKYKTLIETSKDGISLMDLNGVILFINQRKVEMVGANNSEQLLGTSAFNLLTESSRMFVETQMPEILQQGFMDNIESEVLRLDGSIFSAEFNVTVLKDLEGNPCYFMDTMRDISKRKIAETDARKSAMRYKNALEALPVGCLLSDVDGNANYVNQTFTNIFGYTLNDIPNSNAWFHLAHPNPEYRKRVIEEWNKDSRKLHVDGLSTVPLVFDVTTKNGEIKTIEFRQSLFEGELLVLFSDITMRKKAQDALTQSEELFKSLIELAPNTIVLTDMDGCYLIVNNTFLKETGYTLEEVVGKKSNDIGLGLDDNVAEYIHHEIITNGKVENIETTITDKLGNKHDIYYSSKLIQLNDRPVILSSTINITEKKKIERELDSYRNHLESVVKERTEELQQNIEELQTTQDSLETKNKELHQVQLELLKEKKLIDALMDTIPDAIYFKDLQSRFLKVSRSMQANLNKEDKSGILGKTDFDFFSEEHAIAAFEDEQRIISTGIPIVELIEKETWKDGHVTYVSTNKLPLYDLSGKIIGTFGISRDITRLIEMEAAIKQQNEELIAQREELAKTVTNLKQAQKQLVLSEKMASLGVLAAGVAHEINNPLNFINGGILGLENYFIDNLQEHFEEVSPLINGIHIGISRAAAIVTSLNHYSQRDDLPRTECDIHSIIDNCLIMLQSETKNRIEILKNYSKQNYRLICNESKLHQAIFNILANACQAIETNGNISITTKIDLKKLYIIIADNGCGIKKTLMPKIFDPFFTTKDPGKGIGLGLSMTYNIIQEHNGNIELDSNEGKGTTVIIRLPLNNKAEKGF